MLGLSPDEKELIDGDRSYFEPLLPMRDENGRVLTLDLRWTLPLANDLLPEMRNKNLRIPWALSGPGAQVAMEQSTGKDMFLGRSFIPGGKDSTLYEELQARVMQAVRTAAPIPTTLTPMREPGRIIPEYKPYGPRRIGRAYTGEGEETVARAIMGVVFGVNIRKPYVAEYKVKETMRNLLAEGEPATARQMLRLWNDIYKPDHLKRLTMKGIRRGAKQSRAYDWTRYRDDAADAILRGDDEGAEKVISRYRKRYPKGRKLGLGHAQWKARQMQRRGKTK